MSPHHPTSPRDPWNGPAAGARLFTARTRVRYAETDASGIVYYANYFIYFEIGRLAMFQALNLPYDYHLPIADTRCQYRAPARFDDLLEVHSIVEELRRCGFRIGHRVHRVEADGTLSLLAQGYTAMVTTDEERHPIPLPPRYRDALEAAWGPLVDPGLSGPGAA